MQWSTSPHRPPHLYIDEAWYFITASTINSVPVLVSDQHLSLWADVFHHLIEEFNLTMAAWVILPNHCHFLFMPRESGDLGLFMKRLNGGTSRKLNLLDNMPGRTVWYSYWDRCMRDENDFWTRFNYIHENPVRHGYVNNPEDWKFSSYHFYMHNDEIEWLDAKSQEFPVLSLFDDDKF